MILSVDLIIWSIRGFHFGLLTESIGPKILMVKEIVRFYFIIEF
jgi:hypothetical protein